MVTSVEQAVERDLAEMGKAKPGLEESALAAAAVALAREIDKSGNSATSKSMCARVLGDTLERLRALVAETAHEHDQLDDLSARRAKRVAG